VMVMGSVMFSSLVRGECVSDTVVTPIAGCTVRCGANSG
jgi:hypothetical protein